MWNPSLKSFLPKAHDPNAGVASSILACIGELAKVGGEDLYPYIKGLMPLILETLQDQSSSVKRDTSLRTLGELASNSGYVIQPYLDFPNLFRNVYWDFEVRTICSNKTGNSQGDGYFRSFGSI